MGFNGLVRVYTKAQLVRLCEAYGVSQISRLNKTNLAQRLATAILTNSDILLLAAVDSRQYTGVSSAMDPTSGRICSRLSSVPVRQPSQSGINCC